MGLSLGEILFPDLSLAAPGRLDNLRRSNMLELSVETRFPRCQRGSDIEALCPLWQIAVGIRLGYTQAQWSDLASRGVDCAFPFVIALTFTGLVANAAEKACPNGLPRSKGNGSYNPGHRETQGSHARTG